MLRTLDKYEKQIMNCYIKYMLAITPAASVSHSPFQTPFCKQYFAFIVMHLQYKTVFVFKLNSVNSTFTTQNSLFCTLRWPLVSHNKNQIFPPSEEKITCRESIGCPPSGVTRLAPKMGILQSTSRKLQKNKKISNQ